MKNIMFIAPPAAGKGTQAELIVNKYNIPHISTGYLNCVKRRKTETKLNETFCTQHGPVPRSIVWYCPGVPVKKEHRRIDSNWTWRAKNGMMSKALAKRILEMTKLYGRYCGKK